MSTQALAPIPDVRHEARSAERRRLLLWLGPPAVWFAVFMLLPHLSLLYVSLGHMDYVDFVPGFSAANYVKIFTVEPYLGVTFKSFNNGLMTAVLASLIAYPLALWMAFGVSSARARALVSVLVILPWLASYMVKAYAWKTILGTQGVVNSLLVSAGVVAEPLETLMYSRFAVILTLTYIFTPFCVISIYAQLERIPPSLIEAARNLGATDLEILRRIVLPISIPGVFAGAVIVFSLAFSDFITSTLVGGPSDLMISSIMINLFGVSMDRPLASAIGFLMLALAAVLLVTMQWVEKRVQVRF
jgi:spermidine/putrescine transport system permease protein